MSLGWLDYLIFFLMAALLVYVSYKASRKTGSAEEYFMANRALPWWLIGFSLIVSNISTEHFVGLMGGGYRKGLAMASYEWLASITLVFVALFMLPTFLRTGINTLPEFLEYRYNKTARLIMSIYMVLAYIFVALAVVLYSSGLAFDTLMPKSMMEFSLRQYVWFIGLVSAAFILYGGLTSVIRIDLIIGILQVVCGVIITIFAFHAIGGFEEFVAHSDDKLHTILPLNDHELPWISVFFGGMWIAHIFYWGLNQYITQRALAARTLSDGQKGMLFAASIKLLIPIFIVFPGIIAYELYHDMIGRKQDLAFPILVAHILPTNVGLKGFVVSAMLFSAIGATISILNSASTIFTLDIYKQWIHKNVTERELINVGRISTFVIVILSCLMAPILDRDDIGVYQYIQTFWGFISPGVLSVFIFGLFNKYTPPKAAIFTLILNIPIYYLCLTHDLTRDLSHLNNMGITFVILFVFNLLYTGFAPLKTPVVLPERKNIKFERNLVVVVWSIFIITATATLYTLFI